MFFRDPQRNTKTQQNGVTSGEHRTPTINSSEILLYKVRMSLIVAS